MLKIQRTKITLTRGDTAFISLYLTDNDNKPYVPDDNDDIIFRLKLTASDEDPVLLEKHLVINEDGKILLEIQDTDTDDLQFETYRYEIEVVTSQGYHFTAIENAEFIIGPELEVHYEQGT